MPTYNFLDKKTGERFEKVMGMSEVDKFAKDNPHLEWLCSAPALADPFKLGLIKPPEVFRDRLREIKKSQPKSTFNII